MLLARLIVTLIYFAQTFTMSKVKLVFSPIQSIGNSLVRRSVATIDLLDIYIIVIKYSSHIVPNNCHHRNANRKAVGSV